MLERRLGGGCAKDQDLASLGVKESFFYAY